MGINEEHNEQAVPDREYVKFVQAVHAVADVQLLHYGEHFVHVVVFRE